MEILGVRNDEGWKMGWFDPNPSLWKPETCLNDEVGWNEYIISTYYIVYWKSRIYILNDMLCSLSNLLRDKTIIKAEQ